MYDSNGIRAVSSFLILELCLQTACVLPFTNLRITIQSMLQMRYVARLVATFNDLFIDSVIVIGTSFREHFINLFQSLALSLHLMSASVSQGQKKVRGPTSGQQK